MSYILVLRTSVSMLFFLFTGYLDLNMLLKMKILLFLHFIVKKKGFNLLYINDHQILQELRVIKKLPRTQKISLYLCEFCYMLENVHTNQVQLIELHVSCQ